MEAILELVRPADAHLEPNAEKRRKAHSDSSLFAGIAVRFAELLRQKDPNTLEHGARVYRYAERLGRALGLGGDQLDIVRRAGYLHDVGKINMPVAILKKQGPLAPDERKMVELHASCGENLLSEARNSHMRAIATAVGAHHENYDGTGYPNGLAGEAIPLAARIIAVCDSFDAMTSDRSYGEAVPVAVALTELQAKSGTQFDPAAVSAFIHARCWETGDSRSTAPAPAAETLTA